MTKKNVNECTWNDVTVCVKLFLYDAKYIFGLRKTHLKSDRIVAVGFLTKEYVHGCCL